MLITKAQRKAIYKALFEDGVMVAKKHKHPKTMHGELKLIPNLHIILTMQSLVSRNFVKESYSWNFYHWTLTNEGIIYLRGYLHLPADVVPTTLINRPRAVSRPAMDRSFPNPRNAEDRGIYRRMERPEGSSHKRDDAGAGTTETVSRGGFGSEDRGIYRRSAPQEGSSYKRDGAGAGTSDMVFRGGFGRGRQNDEK